MALEELINEHRQELNNTDMGIWKYIVQHRAAVRRSSIHELARACNVSTTTIVRFAQSWDSKASVNSNCSSNGNRPLLSSMIPIRWKG